MFTKTQAYKIKNCDKKKPERNVERLKNNTKRRESKNTKKTTFALLKQRHKTKTKTDTRNGCKVYSSKAKETTLWAGGGRAEVSTAAARPVEGNRIAECKVRQKLTRNFLFFSTANPYATHTASPGPSASVLPTYTRTKL